MTNDTPSADACPHCGCQTKDPFGMGKTIHDVEKCKRNRHRSGIEGCWHAANTYDGNFMEARHNVMTIASARLNHKINHNK